MIAIIPARGGSKGLPNKNIKELNGIPLIAYTIKAALAAKHVSRIIISTDSPEIAEIGIRYGAEVPFLRPTSLSQDNSKIIDAFIYTIERLNTEENATINTFIKLQPTSPLRTSQHIDEAIQLFYDKKPDSLISYIKMPHPPEWACKIDNGKVSKYFNDGSEPINRQELPQAYMPNGAIYILQYKVLKVTRQYITNNTIPYIMPTRESTDIDNLEDFELAEYYLNR
jgi:N-acylneuraminate cytidylyltransferase/CMP-N,N'-diacetyllegionaminic acid synthase